MTRLLMVLLVIGMTCGPAWGQGGALGVFPDPQGLGCGLIDGPPGLVIGYVVHQFTAGVTASRFMVQQGGGTTLTYLADQVQFPYFNGNSQTGVTVCYFNCLSAPIVVMQILYFGVGTSPPCSWIEVVADPVSPSGSVEAVDCNDDIVLASGWWTPINQDPSCQCWITAPPEGAAPSKRSFPYCDEVPTERQSWGKIKALYGNE